MIGDHDKSWAPHFSCATCAMCLRNWLNAFCTSDYLEIAKRSCNDCYFCITDISGFSAENKKNIVYPVNHIEDFEIPKPQHNSHDAFLPVDKISLESDEEFIPSALESSELTLPIK